MQTQNQHKGRTAFHAGSAAEAAVARVYERGGCHVLAQRWRSEAGEIDIIVRAGNEIVFVEVKTSRNFERAASRITRQQQARIYRSAEVFLGTQPQGLLTPARFDVALVDGTGAIEIIENAFGHE